MRHDDVSFDDAGRPTVVVDPVFPGDEPEAPPRSDRSDAARTWLRLLQWLASGGDARRAGERVVVLSFLLRLPDAPTSVRELGKALGVSPATSWRRLKRLREEIARISREDAVSVKHARSR